MIGMHILLSSRFLLKFYIFLKKFFETANQATRHPSNRMNLSDIRQKKFRTFDGFSISFANIHVPFSYVVPFPSLPYTYTHASLRVWRLSTEAVETLYYKKKQPASYIKNGWNYFFNNFFWSVIVFCGTTIKIKARETVSRRHKMLLLRI